MNKRGFTIIEFVVSIAIMFIAAASVVPILFKKQAKPIEQGKKNGIKVCTCENSTTGQCSFTFEKSEQKEFYTVELIGGGASGGSQKGGNAGETKVIYYPALDGEYVIRLGQGGTYSDSKGTNGGNTVLYKKVDGKLRLVEYARGGITNNEEIDTDLTVEEQDNLKKGLSPALNSTVATVCGKGGDAKSAGTMGEVIIRW